jgi:hypothetical protein
MRNAPEILQNNSEILTISHIYRLTVKFLSPISPVTDYKSEICLSTGLLQNVLKKKQYYEVRGVAATVFTVVMDN